MAKTVNLTIGERAKAIEYLNGSQFNNSTLAVVLGDIKNIAITDEEWKDANLVKTPTPDGNERWTWDETFTKDVELDSATVDALLGIIGKKSDANELTLSDAAVLTLEKKLKAD